MKKSAKIQRHFKCGKLYSYHNDNVAYYTKARTLNGWIIIAMYPGLPTTNSAEFDDEDAADYVMGQWMGIKQSDLDSKITFK